jgi:hypothetical protein
MAAPGVGWLSAARDGRRARNSSAPGPGCAHLGPFLRDHGWIRSEAATVDAYVEGLPEGRRDAIEAVRRVVLDRLPDGFAEVMQYGMISWVVPLERYPDTYNGEALAVASLANQKNHMALYLMGVYGDEGTQAWLRERWAATGRKLDMGKSCVRFRRLDDLPLDLVGDAIARIGLDDFLAAYERARPPRR